MRIGLIYYSRTGNTERVMKVIASRLAENSHNMDQFRMEINEPWASNAERLSLKEFPDIQSFDCIILGTPVHGGRLSGAMRTFLEDTQDIHGKDVILLLTHLFWKGWGAEQTFNQMKEICTMKGANVIGSGNVMWLGFGRKKRIAETVDRITEIINNQ